ncbi:M16 family metallopeptidase [Sphingomonas endolithica]|uniref:M16 family metallopeptidase n=1 Tax=Sphingomonas endolithica TaxID=2972485 RepID=UPI0021AE4D69|nr:insulinase family protein [Sphingomonas sp. ZFBP2030]
MHVSSRALRRPLILSLLIGLTLPASGQMAAPQPNAAASAPVQVDRKNWLYVGSDITPDPEWHFGTLPNGVRYAVRRNGVPPGQVAVRVRMDAGSLMEKDSERGYAHLIEHLSFRGSEFVPDGEAKRIWQRMGTTFGSDTNAQTTSTGTTYKLDLPSATEAGLDESLKILAGMVDKPNITAAALNAERPAVLAEQREAPGPQVRYTEALLKTFFAGQPLADRSPIGTVEMLNAATAESVRAFHDRWYRPERAVVVISGDFDPEMFERLVIKNFAGWQGTGPKPAEPDFGKPDPKQPATAVISEPTLPPVVSMAVLKPWFYKDDTILMNQNRLVDSVAARVISRRLETRARAGGSFLQASVNTDDESRSATMTTVSIVPIGDDWAAALKDVRAVIADAQAAPPSAAEVQRELADFDTIMRTRVETSRAEAGAAQADDMVQAVDIRETVTAPATIYAVLKDAIAKKMFTPATVLASTKRIFTGDATRVLVNTPTPDEGAAAKLALALKADVTGLAGKRSAQGKVDFSKLPKLGKPATVVSREKVPDFDIEKVVLSNGVRLMLRTSPAEATRVYVRMRFGGGYNALPADRPTPVWAGELALVDGGIGTLKQGDIEQLTAGRRIGLGFDVDEDAFVYGAMTSPTDLADQLRLMAARMAQPGWDPNPIARAKSMVLAGYAGFDASPTGVITRDLEGLLHDGDPRWGTPTRDQVNATTAQSFRALWEPLLTQGPIEVQIFGDIDAEAAIKAVASTIGTLPPRAAPTMAAPPVRFPAHNTTPVVLTHGGPDSQAAAVIVWPTGGGTELESDSNYLDVLAAVFSDRLFDRLRSEAGASYSPSVQSQWPVGMTAGGRLFAIGQVAPQNVDLFFKMSREIAADLVAHPIGEDELQRTVKPMKELILRQATGNQFWLNQLQGASYDPGRIKALRDMFREVAQVTAPQIQAVAERYLRPEKDWTMAVMPRGKDGKAVAILPAAATGAAVTPAAVPAAKPKAK